MWWWPEVKGSDGHRPRRPAQLPPSSDVPPRVSGFWTISEWGAGEGPCWPAVRWFTRGCEGLDLLVWRVGGPALQPSQGALPPRAGGFIGNHRCSCLPFRQALELEGPPVARLILPSWAEMGELGPGLSHSFCWSKSWTLNSHKGQT